MILEVNLYMYLPVCVVMYIITRHVLHKLHNLPPSPFTVLPLIGHLHLLKKPLHKSLSKLSHRYGPVLFLQFGSRRVLHVASPSAAEECLTKNDIVFANRPRLLSGKHFGYNYTSIAWAPYGDHWRNLRRISALEILSSTRLNLLSDVRLDEVRTLVHRFLLASSENPGQNMDLNSAFFGFMFNVMTRMMAGKRFYDANLTKSEEAKRFQDIVTDTKRLNAQSNMGDFLPILRWFLMGKLEKLYMEVQKRRDEFMQEWINEYRATGFDDLSVGGREKTMLQVLLSLQEAEPEYYTDKEIKSLSQALIHAGISTSVETMEWTMSLLLNHPKVLKKAQKEIDSLVGYDRLIIESDVAHLPYLQSIIKETLRMHPVAPLLLPHESSQDCMVGGYHVPRGTVLLVNVWAIQNDPSTWEDPEVFRPERFEGEEDANIKEGLHMMPFGSGRRRCPGENLAMRIVGLALGSLVQCFDWERVTEDLVDMTEGGGFTAPKALPLMAKCRTRSTITNLLSHI